MEKKSSEELQFFKSKHEEYLLNLDKTEDEPTYIASEYLRVPGGFWCVGSLKLMRSGGDLKKEETLSLLQKCCKLGGYGANVMHDPSLTTTHYAILLFGLYESLFNKELVDLDGVAKYIAHLQKADGSFMGDDWGETDIRFTYYAVAGLKLLDRLSFIDTKKATEYILRCCNPDGAFGIAPGSESHAAYSFCVVAALKVMDRLHEINVDKLAAWLSKRQTLDGGFNGRPEKLPDVCYSWWVLSTLYLLERDHWCNKDALKEFILRCQGEDGGIADRQGNEVDVFHTFFGTAALALMGQFGLSKVDPIFVIPVDLLLKIFPHANVNHY